MAAKKDTRSIAQKLKDRPRDLMGEIDRQSGPKPKPRTPPKKKPSR